MNANSDNGPEPDIISKSMRPEAVGDLFSQDGIRPMGTMPLCCEFRFKSAGDSDFIPAGVPI
ncbi:MAG TPA: hypothetical protein VHT52_20395 [Stellaceae bacterium]|nr:hypothetical protein [Stellaceae bacterium]